MCVGGIYVVPDYVYWDVWVIHLSAIHGPILRKGFQFAASVVFDFGHPQGMGQAGRAIPH